MRLGQSPWMWILSKAKIKPHLHVIWECKKLTFNIITKPSGPISTPYRAQWPQNVSSRPFPWSSPPEENLGSLYEPFWNKLKRNALTFLCPPDSPLAGVNVIFKFCLQDCGPLPDFLRVRATGFLQGSRRIRGKREFESGIMKQFTIDLITVKSHSNHPGANKGNPLNITREKKI